MRRPMTIIAIMVLLGPAGCGRDLPARSAPAPSSASPQGIPSSAPAGPEAVRCDGKEPAPLDPFPHNKDAARRDGMLHFYPESPKVEYVGGVAFFDELDSATLATLITEKFADPQEKQNAAPTTWEIFQFLCRHPDVRAMGYVTSIEREDYRTSLETVYAAEITAALRADAEKFCVDADAVELDDHLECFWD